MTGIRALQPENLGGVVIYHDANAAKYPKEIKIPPTVNKVKKFHCLPGMEVNQTRGQNLTDVEKHVQTFELMADRGGLLLNKLFS